MWKAQPVWAFHSELAPFILAQGPAPDSKADISARFRKSATGCPPRLYLTQPHNPRWWIKKGPWLEQPQGWAAQPKVRSA